MGLALCIHSQARAEQLAENYHNTWGRKKKQELEAKGEGAYPTAAQTLLLHGPSCSTVP